MFRWCGSRKPQRTIGRCANGHGCTCRARSARGGPHFLADESCLAKGHAARSNRTRLARSTGGVSIHGIRSTTALLGSFHPPSRVACVAASPFHDVHLTPRGTCSSWTVLPGPSSTSIHVADRRRACSSIFLRRVSVRGTHLGAVAAAMETCRRDDVAHARVDEAKETTCNQEQWEISSTPSPTGPRSLSNPNHERVRSERLEREIPRGEGSDRTPGSARVSTNQKRGRRIGRSGTASARHGRYPKGSSENGRREDAPDGRGRTRKGRQPPPPGPRHHDRRTVQRQRSMRSFDLGPRVQDKVGAHKATESWDPTDQDTKMDCIGMQGMSRCPATNLDTTRAKKWRRASGEDQAV